jgi:hypothetical protein
VHNEKRGAASLKPSPDTYRLAKARMKSVGDACFSLLFAGSMSLFRAEAEQPLGCPFADRSQLLLCVARNAYQTVLGPVQRCRSTRRRDGHIGELLYSGQDRDDL